MFTYSLKRVFILLKLPKNIFYIYLYFVFVLSKFSNAVLAVLMNNFKHCLLNLVRLYRSGMPWSMKFSMRPGWATAEQNKPDCHCP